jgi:hypothetical protein
MMTWSYAVQKSYLRDCVRAVDGCKAERAQWEEVLLGRGAGCSCAPECLRDLGILIPLVKGERKRLHEQRPIIVLDCIDPGD